MTGLERNADIVFAASYAPLLMNVANYQWASLTTFCFFIITNVSFRRPTLLLSSK